MIKLRYDRQTGKVGNGYCDNIQVPEPFLLITEAEHDTIKNDTQNIYYIKDGKFITINRAQYEEKKRIATMFMTKLDFYKYVLEPKGITYSALQDVLNTNETLNATWQFCNNVYRGDEVLNEHLGKHIDITNEELDEIFKRYGKSEEVI